RYVKITLMVGHQNTRATNVQIFKPIDMDMNTTNKQNGSRPCPGYQMRGIPISAEKSDDDNNGGQNNRCQNNIDNDEDRMQKMTYHVIM
ncbi:MAG: hypothetical protein ACR2PH_06670, partial [Desulfobulbia bacterium]